MFNWLIKALGGYTREDYRAKSNFVGDLKSIMRKIDSIQNSIDVDMYKLVDQIHSKTFDNENKLVQIKKDVSGLHNNQMILRDKIDSQKNRLDITELLPENRMSKVDNKIKDLKDMEDKKRQNELSKMHDRKTYKDCIVLKLWTEKNKNNNNNKK